jgi:glycosyltransferase involved in cell wall biosynthesis
MYLAYVSTKSYTSTTADHFYIKKLAEAFSRAIPGQFSLVINNDHSGDELGAIGGVVMLQLGRRSRALKFFLHFPTFYRELTARAKGERIVLMANDKYILAIARVYTIFGYRLSLCSDWHVLSALWLDRFVARGSLCGICVTSPLRDRVIAFGLPRKRILVSPNAIDRATFSIELSKRMAREGARIPEDKIVLGYFGRFKTMGEEKGVSAILAALVQLDERYIFFGAGALPAELLEYQTLAEKLGVAGRVILKGDSSQAELAHYQRASDILLMPFPFTEHYAYVMSPMKMFEYLASGRPIIATDLPSVRDVLNEQNAVLVPPGDTHALVTAIEALAKDPARGEALAAQGRIYIQTRTWDTKAKEILSFIERALATAPR